MISRVNVSIPFFALVLLVASSVHAQAPARARPEPPKSARESAALDLTGQWVSIVNEDWRWRMVTPPKGDTTSVQPLNAAGKALADQWDPSEDGSCRAFGAAGVMRMPTRLRIDWDGDDLAAWLAPMVGVHTSALYVDPKWLHVHLGVALRVTHKMGAGCFAPVDLRGLDPLGLGLPVTVRTT